MDETTTPTPKPSAGERALANLRGFASEAEIAHRPREAETLAELVAAGRISGPRALAIVLERRRQHRFAAEVERARGGDTSVSVAAQAVAHAQRGAA